MKLSDFSVRYYLLAHLEQPKNRHEVLSILHGQIQDAFNEFGTQIMSPHFEGQPEKKVFVPKAEWYSAPASTAVVPRRRKTGGSGRGRFTLMRRNIT